MSQSHLVIDFPIKGPANAKALRRRAAAVDARSREGAGRPRYRALLPFHDRGGREASLPFGHRRRGRRAHRAARGAVPAPCSTPSSNTWTTLRPRPWLRPAEKAIKWLKRHVRDPIDTYFALQDASVQDIKACARAAGFTGNTSQDPLLTYMDLQVTPAGHRLEA